MFFISKDSHFSRTFVILKAKVRPSFCVKLDFEIAVDQTFKEDADPERPPVPIGQPCPYVVCMQDSFARARTRPLGQARARR